MGVRDSRKGMMSVSRCREGDVGVWMRASGQRESGVRGGLRRSDGVESALRAVVVEERGEVNVDVGWKEKRLGYGVMTKSLDWYREEIGF